MEVIRIPGYTEDEKLNICERYLAPKQIKQNGLKKEEIKLGAEALLDVIRYYTKEAGVRGLEREVAKICRKWSSNLRRVKYKARLKLLQQCCQIC
jgi:ATP-dependent Lon protease